MIDATMTIWEAAAAAFIAAQREQPTTLVSKSAIDNFTKHNDCAWGLLNALRALGLTDEQLQAPAGSVVTVPVEMTPEMRSSAYMAYLYQTALHEAWTPKKDPDPLYEAMIAARPGAGDKR